MVAEIGTERAAERLGDRHDVRHDPEVLAREPAYPVRPSPVWISSRIKQGAHRVARGAHLDQVVHWRHDDAALALHRFEDYGRGLSSTRCAHRLGVAEGHGSNRGISGSKGTRNEARPAAESAKPV